MTLPVTIILYIILASLVVFFSIKLADYVDLIDKKSDLSGAFIGGVVLAAVTSLPELFTSVSSVVFLKKPDLVMGNILGSNLFNECILAFLMVIWGRAFAKSVVGKSHTKTTLISLFLFVMMFLATYVGIDFSLLNISVYTAIIFITYAVSIKAMAGDTAENDEECTSTLTMKQIIIRFIIMAILLVTASILVTFVTDELAAKLNLGATVAGALFLGIATSLPELTSSITLAKKGNFNATVGNIMGSGMFNFTILGLADLLHRGGSIYASEGSKMLVLFGTIATILVTGTLLLKGKNKDNTKLSLVYRLSGLAILACYVLFIVLS
ncbi:MAG: cation transporter [Ruminococcus sp.]|nr:cation transporter [Ruminococcus sp.]